MLENRINSLLISTNSGFKLKEKKIVSIYNSRGQVLFMFSFTTVNFSVIKFVKCLSLDSSSAVKLLRF